MAAQSRGTARKYEELGRRSSSSLRPWVRYDDVWSGGEPVLRVGEGEVVQESKWSLHPRRGRSQAVPAPVDLSSRRRASDARQFSPSNERGMQARNARDVRQFRNTCMVVLWQELRPSAAARAAMLFSHQTPSPSAVAASIDWRRASDG